MIRRKFLLWMIVITILLLISGSLIIFNLNKENEMTVSIGTEITMKVSEFEGASDNLLFQDIFMESIPLHAELGEIVNISFNNKGMPDEIIVKEYILDSEGNMVYNSLAVYIIETIKNNNHYEYTLSKSFLQYLSSSSYVLYGDDIIYRGVKVKCIYGDEEQSYYFVISTTG